MQNYAVRATSSARLRNFTVSCYTMSCVSTSSTTSKCLRRRTQSLSKSKKKAKLRLVSSKAN